MSLSEDDWALVFDLRCKSKRGERLTGREFALIEKAHRADPDRYAAMNKPVFEETRPWPSPRKDDSRG